MQVLYASTIIWTPPSWKMIRYTENLPFTFHNTKDNFNLPQIHGVLNNLTILFFDSFNYLIYFTLAWLMSYSFTIVMIERLEITTLAWISWLSVCKSIHCWTQESRCKERRCQRIGASCIPRVAESPTLPWIGTLVHSRMYAEHIWNLLKLCRAKSARHTQLWRARLCYPVDAGCRPIQLPSVSLMGTWWQGLLGRLTPSSLPSWWFC